MPQPQRVRASRYSFFGNELHSECVISYNNRKNDIEPFAEPITMRTLLVPFALLILLSPTSAVAQAPSPFDLVRGLRDEGMPELALEYLNKIKAENPPAEILASLPLEYARTRLEMAALEVEDSKRNAQLALARTEFDAFLKANPMHPQRPQANLEVARLISLQGKSQLSKARRQDGKEAKLTEIKKARPLFEEASKRFDAASKELTKQSEDLNVESPAEKKLKVAVDNAIMRARIEAGIALYDLGQTYVGDDEVRQRGKYIDDAKKILDEVSTKDDKNPICWLARAWVAQCDYENDRKNDADTQFKALFAEAKNPAARDGIRQGKYFAIRHRFDSQAANRYALIVTDATNWLTNYPRYADSAEGIATRYLMALAIQTQAESNLKRDPKTGKLATAPVGVIRQQMDNAARIYKKIADTDNEYTDRAVRNRLGIILDLSAGRVDDPKKLVTFEEAFLAAQVEQAEFSNTVRKMENPDPMKLEDDQKKAYTRIAELLERAIEVAKPTDPPRDIVDAQILLAYAYLTAGQIQEAAVLSDYLARQYPNMGKTSNVAMIGLSAYNQGLEKLREGGQVNDDALKTDISRIVALAQYMDKTWPTDSVTDTARHQLGFYLMRDKKYPEAFQAFSRISSGYESVYRARMDEGAAAFFLAKSDAAEAVKKAAVDRAKADLIALAVPGEDDEADDCASYVRSQLQLGQLYLLNTDSYAEVEKIGKRIAEQVAKFKNLKGAGKAELMFAARAMAASGIYGQAFQANKEKDYPKVGELLAPILEEVNKEITTPETLTEEEQKVPSRESLKKVQRNILVLSLRSTVQEGKVDKAKETLELLQKAGGSVESTITTLRQVVSEIRGQLDALKKEGKAEDAKNLAKSFTDLLDQIAMPAALPDTMLVFLAQGYSSIDEHAKAIPLLERVKAPQGFAAEPTKKEDLFAAYRNVQLLMAQTYRKAGKFDKAKALLDAMIGTAMKKGWAFSSVEVRKETFYLLEDQKNFRDAVLGWTNYAKAWQKQVKAKPANQQEARVKEIYFDLYVETQRCLALANAGLKDPMVKATYYEKIAKALIEMESRNPELLDNPEIRGSVIKILDEYPLLKEKYKAANGKMMDQEGN